MCMLLSQRSSGDLSPPGSSTSSAPGGAPPGRPRGNTGAGGAAGATGAGAASGARSAAGGDAGPIAYPGGPPQEITSAPSSTEQTRAACRTRVGISASARLHPDGPLHRVDAAEAVLDTEFLLRSSLLLSWRATGRSARCHWPHRCGVQRQASTRGTLGRSGARHPAPVGGPAPTLAGTHTARTYRQARLKGCHSVLGQGCYRRRPAPPASMVMVVVNEILKPVPDVAENVAKPVSGLGN